MSKIKEKKFSCKYCQSFCRKHKIGICDFHFHLIHKNLEKKYANQKGCRT
ncbi:MAG: hypothetical protein MRERV_16c044 [Mycoplasmataceae bacterium RV_VA103A]|nr:MAG: hypothetical protein MRERV_16c044 [Mycoplasmataceae bacterium RV_VA103A]